MRAYPGGKNGKGVYQKLINLIPPHETYIETHLGGGAIMLHKKPAKINIGIDLDPSVIAIWQKKQLNQSKFLQADALNFLKNYSFTGSEFVYSDPPYLMETRRGGRLYKFEYTIEQHIQLLNCLKSLPCMVMLSGYWSKLYGEKLKNWASFLFQAKTRQGVATEWVWLNYPKPTELHDYSFLGNDFHERERIKRKKARWIKKLRTLPLLEQKALLEALKN